jgi:hypothetical protein
MWAFLLAEVAAVVNMTTGWGETALRWSALFVVLASFGCILWMGRALTRTGDPFAGVRWYWPWRAQDVRVWAARELRFGQKPWHRVALGLLAVLATFFALLLLLARG